MSAIIKSSTTNQTLYAQDTVIDVTAVTSLGVMARFRPLAATTGTNYLLTTYPTSVNTANQLAIGTANTNRLMCRARTNAGIVSGASGFSYTIGQTYTAFLSVDLTAQEFKAYYDGVQAGATALTGTAWFGDKQFRLMIAGLESSDDAGFEILEAAYWIDSVISAVDVANYQTGTALSDFTVPPSEIIPCNGIEGEYVDNFPASINPLNFLDYVSGPTTAPDWAVWGVPSTAPPPDVPVGYTRYETDMATADAVSSNSFFYGVAVGGGLFVDLPDEMFEVDDPIGYPVALGDLVTGHVIRVVPGVYSAYFYYFDSGIYEDRVINYIFTFDAVGVLSPIVGCLIGGLITNLVL